MIRYDKQSIALAVSLSALAGYVDALGFINLGGYFVSFMSGNSTRLGIGIGHRATSLAATFLGVIALFVLGVVLGSVVGHVARERRRVATLILVTLLLLAAAALRSLGGIAASGAAMILAMGAENAVFHRDNEVSIGLTYMTGTLVKMGQRLASALFGGPKFGWVPYALLWLGLVFGATVGTVVQGFLPTGGLWIAALYSLALVPISARTLRSR